MTLAIPRTGTAALLLLTFSAAPIVAQEARAVIARGIVVDAATGDPVAGAYVGLKDGRIGPATKTRGEFVLPVLTHDAWRSVSMAFTPPALEVDPIRSLARADSNRTPAMVSLIGDQDGGYSLKRYLGVGAGVGALGGAIWIGVALLRHEGQFDDGLHLPYVIGFPIAVGAAAGGTIGFLLWRGGEATP